MPVASSPTLRVTRDALARVDTDLAIVLAFEDEDILGAVDMDGLDAATGGEIARAVRGEFRGCPYEWFMTPSSAAGWRAGRVALIGAGPRAGFDLERLRRIATAAALAGRQRRVARIAFVCRGLLPVPAAVQAIAEGLMLAAFSSDQYKTGERIGPPPQEVQVVVAAQAPPAEVERAFERGRILGEACNLARALCNEPSNVLTPSVFADRAMSIAGEAGVQVEVLDQRAIEQLGMGLLLGVARGSAEPPRLIVMRHEPAGAPAAPVLGLVGKGITFDTGGISIKPADGMERMKDDMAGGAAVICAMRAIAQLKAPIKVVGVVPTTENMPGGRAVKPGDVLTGASGKTVEVINTDAEGRLVLGDGLWYARQIGATHLVDVATLTGACMIALGRAASGLFGQPDAWRDTIQGVAATAGDRCWPLPLYDEYADQLRSEIADVMNSGGRPAGACTAAMFLKEFAGGRPWAHLDIAGTAWAEDARPYQPKGATGIAVRTLAELPFTWKTWG
ncbi:MAG TPA: leucyl aminopeptidase [Vicinamibacterales bacterium]|nr:leucyl aminopeptidase [Vicinamibacterales bacterium]